VEIRLPRLLWAGVLIALACPTPHAYAQASRLGDTQPLGSSPAVTEKKTAIAYDPDSDVYVVVWGLGSLQAAFVQGQGATATSALLTGIANVSGTQQSPAVAYSPDAKAFLVVWLDFRTSDRSAVYARFIKWNNGTPIVSGPELVLTPATGLVNGEMPPTAAYSTVGKQFLVSWMRDADIWYVAISNQSVAGTPVNLNNDGLTVYHQYPAVTYNPLRNEFFLAYAQSTNVDQVAAVRITGSGVPAVVGGPTVYDQGAFRSETEVQFNPVTTRYLLMWYQSSPGTGIFARVINGDGTPAAAAIPESTVYYGYDGLGLAYNKATNTSFAVSLDRVTVENGGWEVGPSGTPSTGFIVTAAGGSGNFYPTIAARCRGSQFLMVTTNNFTSVKGQRVQTLTNAGGTACTGFGGSKRTGDFDGDGRADLMLYRPSSGGWYFRSSINGATSVTAYGRPNDIPVPGDYDGNGSNEIAVFRPANGNWYIPGQTAIAYGTSGDIPVPSDYTGDGKTDIAVFRPSSGVWFVRGVTAQAWGMAGDVPVPGDYTGTGVSSMAVFRPSTGVWYVRGQSQVTWGTKGDIPVPADYNGDGRTDLAVFRSSNGTWYVKDQFTAQWGSPGDLPVAVDVDGDGKAELGVFRRSNGGWYFYNVANGTASVVLYGAAGDIPAYLGRLPGRVVCVAGDFDGDRKVDPTIFRGGSHWWQILQSSTGWRYYTAQVWGDTGDLPAAGDYMGTGLSQPAVFRPSNGTFYINDGPSLAFGAVDQVPVVGDFDGDGRNDAALFRASVGQITWLKSSTGFSVVDSYTSGIATGTQAAAADFDGDGITDPGIFTTDTGLWTIRLSTTGAIWNVTFGTSGDVVAPTDLDGDGKADFAVFRPTAGAWYFAYSTGGYASVGPVQYGVSTDVPVPMDYNGDGTAEVTVYRPAVTPIGGRWMSLAGLDKLNGDPGDIPVFKRP
jgi:hypothetical protein